MTGGVDPTIALQAGRIGSMAAGNQLNPFETLNTLTAAQVRMNEIRNQNYQFFGTKRAGEIMSQYDKPEDGINALRRDPIAAAFAPDVAQKWSQTNQSLVEAQGAEQTQNINAMHGFIQSIIPINGLLSMGAPSAEVDKAWNAGVQRTLAATPPAERARVIQAMDAVHSSLYAGTEGQDPATMAGTMHTNMMNLLYGSGLDANAIEEAAGPRVTAQAGDQIYLGRQPLDGSPVRWQGSVGVGAPPRTEIDQHGIVRTMPAVTGTGPELLPGQNLYPAPGMTQPPGVSPPLGAPPTMPGSVANPVLTPQAIPPAGAPAAAAAPPPAAPAPAPVVPPPAVTPPPPAAPAPVAPPPAAAPPPGGPPPAAPPPAAAAAPAPGAPGSTTPITQYPEPHAQVGSQTQPTVVPAGQPLPREVSFGPPGVRGDITLPPLQGGPRYAGDGTPLWTNDPNSPMNQPIGAMSAQQSEAADSNMDKYRAGTAALDRMTTIMGQTRDIQNQLDELSRSPSRLAQPGALSGARAMLMNMAQTAYQLLGKDVPKDFDPGATATIQDIMKASNRMGMDLGGAMFGNSHIAVQNVQTALGSVPGMENSALGARLVNASITAVGQRWFDNRDWDTQWLNDPTKANLYRADDSFNQAHPAQDYVDNVFKQFHMTSPGRFTHDQAGLDAANQMHNQGLLSDSQFKAVLNDQFPQQ